MTNAELARALHAAHPELSIVAIAKRLGAQPQAVRSALAASSKMGRPRAKRCDSCGQPIPGTVAT